MTTDTASLRIGTVLKGKRSYTIKRVLGKGGFGITYEATAPFIDGNIRQTMRYTLKEFFMHDVCIRHDDGTVQPVPSREVDFKTYQEHFAVEAKRMRDVCKHPNIVSVNEVFEDLGTSYYVMEFLEGQTLEDKVKSEGPLQENDAMQLANKVGEALSFLHEQRINHLDVKPENIMLIWDEHNEEQPILIDFGLSRHFKKTGAPTSVLANFGCSDGYSPIEQYVGIERFSPEADVYAFAATLVFALSGKTPCRSIEMGHEWLMRNLPANVTQTTQRALEEGLKSAATERPQSIRAFLSLLPIEHKHNDDVPSKGKPQSTETRIIGTPKKKKTSKRSFIGNEDKRLGFYAIAVLLILIITAVMTFMFMENKNEELVAESETAIEVKQPESQVSAPADTIAEAPKAEVAPEETKKADEPKKEESTQQPKEKKAEPQATNANANANTNASAGTLNLGYATYEGKLRMGVPHGRGTLTFMSAHAIDSYDPQHRTASAGDKVSGMFYDGHLTQGKWTKATGETENIVIGN